MSMNTPRFDDVTVGDTLPPLHLPPITRTTLALFAGASGDHNPVHIDIDYAKAAGMQDVFAHGMLSMAYLGRFITLWVPQSHILNYNVRFSAITRLNAKLTCIGKVAEKMESDNQRRVKLEIGVIDDNGEVKLTGDAWLSLH